MWPAVNGCGSPGSENVDETVASLGYFWALAGQKVICRRADIVEKIRRYLERCSMKQFRIPSHSALTYTVWSWVKFAYNVSLQIFLILYIWFKFCIKLHRTIWKLLGMTVLRINGPHVKDPKIGKVMPAVEKLVPWRSSNETIVKHKHCSETRGVINVQKFGDSLSELGFTHSEIQIAQRNSLRTWTESAVPGSYKIYCGAIMMQGKIFLWQLRQF